MQTYNATSAEDSLTDIDSQAYADSCSDDVIARITASHTYLLGQQGDDRTRLWAIDILPEETFVATGGDGRDYIYINGDEIDGGLYANGDSEDDHIYIFGLAGGFDLGLGIDGGAGNDQIHVDIIAYHSMNYIVVDDRLPLGVVGGEGDDTIVARRENDPTDDRVLLVEGGGGNDHIDGEAARSFLSGGSGDDIIIGWAGGGHISGGDGNDRIELRVPWLGGPNPIRGEWVEVAGGAGDDRFVVATSVHLIDGGSGYDRVEFDDSERRSGVTMNLRSGPQSVENTSGIAELRQVEAVAGTRFADTLYGGGDVMNLDGYDGDDVIVGGLKNEVLRGGAGVDRLDGGAGSDTADFRDKSAPVVLSLNGAATAVATVGGVADDSVRNIESIYGGSGADTFRGDARNNALVGFDGNDVLRGLSGADVLTGGAGRDAFVYNWVSESTVAADGRDTIRDFDGRGGDRIVLRDIDANTIVAGDQAFTLGALTVGVAGRLAVSASGSGWLVQGDVDGDGVADLAILVNGAMPTGADFVL